jgi:hypothetical protein
MMQPSAAFGQHVLDSTNFHIEWGNVDPNNPERVDVLQWKGGLNLIGSYPGFPPGCSTFSEFFSNSVVEPWDYERGTLVGSDSKGSWTLGSDGVSADITSMGSGCPTSARIPLKTRYMLFNADGQQNNIAVVRTFQFGTVPFTHDFHPYIPRLYPRSKFSRVVHPDASHTTLVVENALLCTDGCMITNWDGTWCHT